MLWRILQALPSFIVAAICIAIIHADIKLNGYQWETLSLIKIFGLAGIAAAALYAMGSALSRRLCRLNNLIALNLLIIFAGTEGILRIMEDTLPVSIVTILPTSDRIRLLKNRGLFVADNISGDGLLHAWKPNAIIKNLPWVKVDANGYRNPKVPRVVDVVLLGDSVTIAQNSKQDMGDFLRAGGISTLNLGFGSYGPFHQRDAYQKYVLDAGIVHRLVLINFCACNDVTDAQSYINTMNLGGTWRDYLGTTPNKNAFPFSFQPPWVISILFNLPYKAVQNFRNQKAKAGEMTIRLARGNIRVTGWPLPSEPHNMSDKGWEPALTALTDIVRRAKAVGAKPVIAYYPNLAQIISPGLPPSSPIRNAAKHDLNDAVVRLRSLALRENAIFVDYTEPMKKGNDKMIVTASEGDYHPNTNGVKIMVEAVFPTILKILRP